MDGDLHFICKFNGFRTLGDSARPSQILTTIQYSREKASQFGMSCLLERFTLTKTAARVHTHTSVTLVEYSNKRSDCGQSIHCKQKLELLSVLISLLAINSLLTISR